MANRLELGGYYPSRGEQSEGELRARYWVEYSTATANKMMEIFTNNPDEYDSMQDVLADMVAGELDDELASENEVNPEEYDREEWIEAQAEADGETAEADD